MKVTTDACLFGAWVAEEMQGKKYEVKKVLDIGTGTGLLSLMLAQKNPSVVIDTIEIDKDAAKQAEENIQASIWSNRIQLIHADAKEITYTKKYDCIISNPPFYESELKGGELKKNIAHHDEGLLLAELLKIITTNLQPGGEFFLLLPYKRQEEIKQLLIQHETTVTKLAFVRQSVNHDYFRIMLAGKNKPGEEEMIIDEITIKDENDKYTPEFTALLKDYYLYL